MTLPELGYADKVRVCKSCCMLKTGRSKGDRNTASASPPLNNGDDFDAAPDSTSFGRSKASAATTFSSPDSLHVGDLTDKLGVPASFGARQSDLPASSSNRTIARAARAAASAQNTAARPPSAASQLPPPPPSLAGGSSASTGGSGTISAGARSATKPGPGSLIGGLGLGPSSLSGNRLGSASAIPPQEPSQSASVDDDYDY